MEVALADLRAGSDAFTPDCPTRVLLDHITSRWGVLILVALSSGTMRWGELRRWARGIRPIDARGNRPGPRREWQPNRNQSRLQARHASSPCTIDEMVF